MKKYILMTVVVAVALMLGGCKRNYQVNYSHVPVDTLQHNDLDTVVDIYEEPLYDVPDAPGEITVGEIMSKDTRQAGRDAEKLFSGEPMDD
jgi:hypothetical protein